MDWQTIDTAPEEQLIEMLLHGNIVEGTVKQNVEHRAGGVYPHFYGGTWTWVIKEDPASWPTHWRPKQ